MPNIWAHIQFGNEVFDDIQAVGPIDGSQWKKAFHLGCQGPDFLFYHRFLPWQKPTPLHQLGTLMHNVRCGPFLLSLFDAVRGRPMTDPAVAYALGFLLHHVLDRNLHPYIFSRSGFKKWHHQRFETAMDSVVMWRRAGLHTGKNPVAPRIDTGGRLPGGITEDFLRIVAVHYPAVAEQVTAKSLDEAVADMVGAMKLFYDPSGWKKKLLFGQIDPFSPQRVIPSWDVLNDAKASWIDPTDRSVVHTSSAMELWDLALADGRAITACAVAWLGAADETVAASHRAVFAELLRDVSYETGLPCGSAWITFAESIVPV